MAKIERLVYIPSKLVLASGESEDDILNKVWQKIRKQYNGNELTVLKGKICVDRDPFAVPEKVAEAEEPKWCNFHEQPEPYQRCSVCMKDTEEGTADESGISVNLPPWCSHCRTFHSVGDHTDESE